MIFTLFQFSHVYQTETKEPVLSNMLSVLLTAGSLIK